MVHPASTRIASAVSSLCLLIAVCLAGGCGEQIGSDAKPEGAAQSTNPQNTAALAEVADLLPAEIASEIEEVSKAQAKGLDEATTIVHRAFHVRSDEGVARDVQHARVGVDVEFIGPGEQFDIEDVDIVDGSTGTNYGSDPYIQLLKPDGRLEQNQAKWELPSKSLRVLLTYVVPVQTTSVQLEYWGHKITSRATPIVEGELKVDDSRIIADVQFWPYPHSRHYGDTLRRGRWLLIELSTGEGVVVADLHAWPPKLHHWNCNLLRAIEPAPGGGWVVITRTGHTRDDIRFPIWRHAGERPGDTSMPGDTADSLEYPRGIVIFNQSVLVYDDLHLYRLVASDLELVEGLEPVKGVNSDFGLKYTHGRIHLAGGRKRLLWDGDGYEWTDGQLKRVWRLGINEPYEFCSLPWGQEGFYFLEDRKVFRIKPKEKREPVMTAVENVMGIRPGPAGTILYHLGDNDDGVVVGLWNPGQDSYIRLKPEQLSGEADSHDFGSLHWSDETKHFYVVGRSGIFTVPRERILNGTADPR